MAELPHTVPEVDLVLTRLRNMDGETIILSCSDAGLLLGEIDGGREAFDVLVQQKVALAQEMAQLRLSISHLLATQSK